VTNYLQGKTTSNDIGENLTKFCPLTNKTSSRKSQSSCFPLQPNQSFSHTLTVALLQTDSCECLLYHILCNHGLFCVLWA